jgi:protein-disulfide isomerase
MVKRLETATNVVLLFGCCFVVGLILKDRFLPMRTAAASTTPSPTSRPAAAPPANTPAAAPAIPQLADIGPDIKPVALHTVPSAAVVARIDGEAISRDALMQVISGQLLGLQSQEYAIARGTLDKAIDRIVLEREASRKGVTVTALLQDVVAKAADPTPSEIEEQYAAQRQRYERLSRREAQQQIVAELKRQRLTQQLQQYFRSLKSAASVSVLLKPPRVPNVDISTAHVRGATDAVVTIVEFADFQCPFCAKTVDSLREIERRYGTTVRVAYKHFPLPIHHDAPRAAEASECASEQGRFWEMYDKLFSASRFDDAQLQKYTSELKLDGGQFSRCLAGGKYTARWQSDKRDGERLGVGATPTFFVNGRILVGAQPLEAFTQIIDEELQTASLGTH